MTTYTSSIEGITADRLAGFFEGWPAPPDPQTHLRILHGSDHVILAREGDAVVGFITAVSDGVLAAYIPLLEVRPEHRGRGIGGELVRRMLERLEHLYMVDLVCDEGLVPYYERFGMLRLAGMARRNFERQSGGPIRR